MNKVQHDLSTKVDLKHIEEFRGEVYPVVAECRDLMDKLRKDNWEMKQCVRTFDENMCEKANKSKVIRLEQ